MRIKILFLFAFLLLCNLCFAEQIEIVNIPIGNSLSFAGESVLTDNGALNVLTNPAMLGMIDAASMFQYNKMFYFADTEYDILGFSFKERTTGVENSVALTVGRFTSGKILVRNIEGVPTGETIEYLVNLAAVGFSSVLSSGRDYSLWLGLAGYGIRESINVESYYWGGNIGLVYRLGNVFKTINFGIGIVFKGMGTNQNILHSEGLSLEFNRIKFIVGYENYLQNKIKDKIKTGVSVNLYDNKNKKHSISVDLGYDFGEYTKTYSCGIDIVFGRIGFSYSFSQYEYLGGIHNLMLSFRL